MRVFEFEHDDFVLQTGHDFDGCDFVWYNSPIDHFDLSNITHRIISFEQLRYYAEVFFFLNSDINLNLFKGIFCYIGTRDSGKCIRTYSKARIEQMIDEVYLYKKDPYCRRMRRVIFNPKVIISTEEKLAVTAQVVKKGMTYSEFDVMQAIAKLSMAQIVITSDSIADELICSRSTVNRLLNPMIKTKIKQENEKIRREKQITKAIEWIDVLSDEGNSVKMQELKSLSNVRDYSVIREAISRYESQS